MTKILTKLLMALAMCLCAFNYSSEKIRPMELQLQNERVLKAIVFDYGGVLSKINMNSTSGFIAREFGVSVDEVKSVFRNKYIKNRMNLFSDEDFWNLISEALQKDIPEGINDRYKRVIYDDLMILNEKKTVLRDLRAKGYKVYMLSNQYPHFNDVLKEQKAFEEFDYSVVSCDYGIKKPTRRIYEILLEAISEKAEECMFVDDTYENIVAAQELGFNTLYYNVFKHSEEEFNNLFEELSSIKQ